MANSMYNRGAIQLADGTLDWTTDVIKCSLASDEYTFSIQHDYMSDVGTAELGNTPDVTGYEDGHGNAGRKTLASPTITLDDSNDLVEYDSATSPSWTGLGNGSNDDVKGAIIHQEGTTDDSDATLICWIDTVTGSPSFPFTTNGSDFTIDFHADGVFYLDMSP
jgi:hypothetical protein